LFQFTPGVPIEVVPFAYAKVLQNLHHILGSPKASLRMAVKKGWIYLRCADTVTYGII
jgi:ribose 5-phosphate isomerase